MDETSMSKTTLHATICEELNTLYDRKNKDYGDSFHLSFVEEGMAMSRIRLGDKLNRFKTLSRKPESEQCVSDESLIDTLMDLANYSIMTIMEIKLKQNEEEIKKEIACVSSRPMIADKP